MSWMTSFFVPKHWIAGNLLISSFLPAFGAGLWNTHATLLHFISRYFATNILLHFSQQTGAGKMSIFYLFSMFPLTMSWSVFLLSLLVLLDLRSCPEWWMEYDESEPRARGIDSTLRSETCSEHQNVLRLRTVEDFRALELQWPWCLLKDKPLAICIHPVPPEELIQPCWVFERLASFNGARWDVDGCGKSSVGGYTHVVFCMTWWVDITLKFIRMGL